MVHIAHAVKQHSETLLDAAATGVVTCVSLVETCVNRIKVVKETIKDQDETLATKINGSMTSF